MKIFLIFANTLFEVEYIKAKYNIDLGKDFDCIQIIEHPIHFKKYKFGKTKLCYHVSTMFDYLYSKLNKNNIKIEYIKVNNFNEKNILKKNNEYFCIDILDKEFEKYDIHIFENMNFLLSYTEHIQIYKNYKTIRFVGFYNKVKQKYNFNYDSMDKENRLTFPKDSATLIPDRITPMIKKNNKKKNVLLAKKYINNNFSNNPPYIDYDIPLILPLNFKDAKEYLNEFLEKCALINFSDYQDAIIAPGLSLSGSILLYHSGISASLNNGLLTIEYILNEIEKKVDKSKENERERVRIKENLFRQMAGWREYQLYCYINKDIYNNLLKSNYFNCNNKLTKELYTGETKIKILDDSIRLGFYYGYISHINRLMIMGIGFMLLNINPLLFKQWMTEWSCDSYDWVMHQNCLGMVYSANGSYTMSKNYLHSINYFKKMTIGYKTEDYGDWDELYQSFIKKNYNKLKTFGRMISFLKIKN